MTPYNYNNYNENKPESNFNESSGSYIPYYREVQPYTTPEPATAKTNKTKKRGGKAGTLALVLAVSLFSGAAGGAGTYYYLQDGMPASQPAASIVDEAATAPVATLPEESNSNAGSSSSGGATDIAGIVAKTSGSVVEISVEATAVNPFFGQYTTGGSGSGVIVSSDGYIVTNDHVIDGAEAITVRTADGEEYEAVLIGTDSQTDLAVLKVEAENLPPVTFADSDKIEVGQLAIAIGNPLGTLGGTVTDGIISAKNREITIEGETMNLLQTSAAVNPGNSGGGLFNADGHLIGIVNAKSSGSTEGLGFAIPSNTVNQVVNDMIEKGYVSGRTEFGITVLQINDPQTAMYYRVNKYGLYVATTNRDSGFEQGDRIISVDGVTVEQNTDLRSILDAHEVGDVLEAVVERDGRETAISVSVGEQVPETIREAAKAEV